MGLLLVLACVAAGWFLLWRRATARGAKASPGELTGYLGGGLPAGVLFATGVAFLVHRPLPPPARRAIVVLQPADTDQTVFMACEAAKSAVLAKLKAPSTADFPGCVFSANEFVVRANEARTKFSVKGHVDAENTYGAKLRQSSVVLLDKAPGDGPSPFTATAVAID